MTVHGRGTAGRRRARAAVGGLVALTLAGVLTGCDSRPGAAAVVDGRVIATSDVRTGTSELAPFLQSVTTLNVLTVLVQAPTVLAVAKDRGVGVSDQQARDLLDQLATQNGATTSPTFTEPSVVVAKYSIAIDHLQALPDATQIASTLQERFGALDVSLNPRFASLADGNTLAAPARRPWIVEPKAAGGADDGSSEPTPTPEQTPTPTPSS